MVKHGICGPHATDLVFSISKLGSKALLMKKMGVFWISKMHPELKTFQLELLPCSSVGFLWFFASFSVALIGFTIRGSGTLSTPCREKETHQVRQMFRIHFIPSHCLHTALELAVHTSHKHCGGGHSQCVSWPPVSESSLSSASETAFLRSEVSEVHTREN